MSWESFSAWEMWAGQTGYKPGESTKFEWTMKGEVPVSGEAVYMPAAELTRESVQGATVDKGKVDVPAGRFQADHAVHMAGSDGGQIEIWLVRC